MNSILASAVIFLANCFASSGLTVQKDVRYGPDDFQRADIYRQKDALARPVIVYLYGGGWRGGSKDRAAFVGSALAWQGFVVVIPEYRHIPRVGLPEILQDHAAAVMWTLTHAKDIGGDPRRVILVGSSSGAWGAAMLALDPRWLRSVGAEPGDLAGMIGLAGPYVTSSLTDQSDRDIFKNSGKDMEPDEHASSPHPPMLLLAGSKDLDVLPMSTATLSAHLEKSVGTVKSRAYEGLDHVDMIISLAIPSFYRASVLQDVSGFARNTSQLCCASFH